MCDKITHIFKFGSCYYVTQKGKFITAYPFAS